MAGRALALAGNLLAIAFYALATLLGLSLLLAAAPSVRLAIYLLGGAYLVWVGLRLAPRACAGRGAGDAGFGGCECPADARSARSCKGC